MELLQVQHRLLWALPDSGPFGQETGLATCLLQLRPLLQLLDEEGGQEQGAGLQCSVEQEALEQYLHYLSSPDLHLRLLLLTKVLGRPEAEELVRSLEARVGQEAWDWRLLPSSCTTKSSSSFTLSNSLSLLLPLRHVAASCQLLLASCPFSFLARSGSTSAEAGMEEPVLKMLPETLTSTVELLQTCLPAAVSLEDSLSASLDCCLQWLRRLLLSLSPLSRDSAELLARRIVVHCRWLYKRLLPAVQEAGCGSLAQLLQEYDSVVRRQPAYQQAKEAPGGVPASPQHPGAVLHPGPALGHRLLPPALLPPAPVHLPLPIRQPGGLPPTAALPGWQEGQVVISLVALQEQYREQVEEGRGRVGVESFLALQTAAVREQVGVEPGSEHLADTATELFRHLALYTLGP